MSYLTSEWVPGGVSVPELSKILLGWVAEAVVGKSGASVVVTQESVMWLGRGQSAYRIDKINQEPDQFRPNSRVPKCRISYQINLSQPGRNPELEVWIVRDSLHEAAWNYQVWAILDSPFYWEDCDHNLYVPSVSEPSVCEDFLICQHTNHIQQTTCQRGWPEISSAKYQTSKGTSRWKDIGILANPLWVNKWQQNIQSKARKAPNYITRLEIGKLWVNTIENQVCGPRTCARPS